jgi:hypothetical protein
LAILGLQVVVGRVCHVGYRRRHLTGPGSSPFGNIFTESLNFYADVPNINVAVSQALNVTSNCEPAPAGTDPTHIYKNLTHVIPSVSYDVDFSLSHIGNLELGPYNGTVLATSCLDYSPQVTSIIPAPFVNPSSGADKSVALPLFSYLLLAALTAIVID